MGINPRQKFKIVDTGLIFNVSKELYPKIEITYQISKKKQIIEANRFDAALENGKIKKLTAKAKAKVIQIIDLVLEYRIKREHIFFSEGKPSVYHELLNQKK